MIVIDYLIWARSDCYIIVEEPTLKCREYMYIYKTLLNLLFIVISNVQKQNFKLLLFSFEPVQTYNVCLSEVC